MKKKVILVGCMLLGACQTDATDIAGVNESVAFTEQSEIAPPDLVAERASLLDADRAYSAASAGTTLVEGETAMFADDGYYFAPAGLWQGPAAIRAGLARSATNRVASFVWTPVRADVSADGQHGYTYGYSRLIVPGFPAPFNGKYHAYWERNDAGEWKVMAYKRVLSTPDEIEYVVPAGFETPAYHHYRVFPNSDPAATLADVFATDRAFSDVSASAGAGAAFGQFVAPDGAIVGPLATFSFGPSEAAAIYEGLAPGQLVWEPIVGDVAASGDLAFTIGAGEFRELLPDGTLGAPLPAGYISIWKRQRTGEWRVVIDG